MKYFHFLFLSFYFLGIVHSQDLIIMRTEGEIIAKVREINRNHILYNTYENQDAEPIKLAKNKIELIVYEDGMKQYFALQEGVADTIRIDVDMDNPLVAYQQGVEDAKVYFNKNGAMWGTFGASLLFPFVGLISGSLTGVVLAAIPPDIDVGDVPNPQVFLASEEYAKGYRNQAHKNKVLKVLKGFAMGVGAQIVMIVIIISSW